MNKKYYFISGLPRSGSTLLSSILNQNPRFTAGISDPLQIFANSIIRDVNGSVGMSSAVPEEKQRDIIRGMFDSFYKTSNEVCFNTNRGWTSDTPLLKSLFPNFKMIVCVREIPWILDSFEQLHRKNPYTVKPLYHHQQLGDVYSRTDMLMGNIPNHFGYVSGPILSTRQAIFSDELKSICFVNYDTLVKFPNKVMADLYKFLGEPFFEHDFNNVEMTYDEFDREAKINGLHTVKKKVQHYNRQTVLPTDLWNKYSSTSFWLTDLKEKCSNLKWLGGQQTMFAKRQL